MDGWRVGDGRMDRWLQGETKKIAGVAVTADA